VICIIVISTILVIFYLRVELNDEEKIYRDCTNVRTAIWQRKTKQTKTRIKDKFCFFIFTPEFLKISVDLQIAFAAESQRPRRAVACRATEHGKSRKFLVGTRMPTVARAEGKNVQPLDTFVNTK
jgi:hypothetical protein